MNNNQIPSFPNFQNEQTLASHYAEILNLSFPWEIGTITIHHEKNDISIEVICNKGHKVLCPLCDSECPRADTRELRKWRHLNILQYTSHIICRVPRSSCKTHGIKTVNIPWASNLTHITTLFYGYALTILKNASSIKSSCAILGLKWKAVMHIMNIAVKKGEAKRSLDGIQFLGLDEKSFLKGHHYITSLVDIKERRILNVAEHRTIDSTKIVLSVLSPEQKQGIKATCMDMWKAFKTGVLSECPKSTIVYDKFHIMKYLNHAVDLIRREEHRILQKNKDTSLTKARFLFLKNHDSFTDSEKESWDKLSKLNLQVSKAWMLKELFKEFYTQGSIEKATLFWKKWYFRVTHSKMKALIKVARMMKDHIDGLLAYITWSISNGITEGFNTTIQAIKTNARGFRNFKNYRTRILFMLGGLDMTMERNP